MEYSAPEVLIALALAVLVAGCVSLVTARRGGRFRALPGWSVFWIFLGAFLVILSRAPWWISVPLLGVVMFGLLREYFFLVPLRPQDRRGILFAYLSVPVVLYPVVVDLYGMFLTVVLLYLFLVLPAALAVGPPTGGMLDSMGRVLLGMLVFVFCSAHLGWMLHQPVGRLELFGVLVVASDLPQRLSGRLRGGNGRMRALVGVTCSTVLAVAAGALLGGRVGITPGQGVAASLLVVVSVTAGGIVSEAVARDLALGPAASRVGRAALLDRITPAIYAAPLYFHFLNRYA